MVISSIKLEASVNEKEEDEVEQSASDAVNFNWRDAGLVTVSLFRFAERLINWDHDENDRRPSSSVFLSVFVYVQPWRCGRRKGFSGVQLAHAISRDLSLCCLFGAVRL